MKNRKKHDKEIMAYAAFDERMNLLYATLNPSKEKCEEQLYRFNPKVAGYPYPYQILPIYIGIDLNAQTELSLDNE